MKWQLMCLIGISVLFEVIAQEVIAQDQFHSRIWQKSVQKINEDVKKRKEEDEMAKYMAGKNFADNPTHPLRAERTKSYLRCADKTGVSPDTILRIRGGDWVKGDRKAMDWVQCVLMENELMTDQSVFRLDVAFKYLTELGKHYVEANVDKCLPTNALPPLEIAWQFAKCYQTVDPENSLF